MGNRMPRPLTVYATCDRRRFVRPLSLDATFPRLEEAPAERGKPASYLHLNAGVQTSVASNYHVETSIPYRLAISRRVSAISRYRGRRSKDSHVVLHRLSPD